MVWTGVRRVHGLVRYICQAPPGQSGLERDQRYACAGVMAPLATSDRSSADCKASAGGRASDFINWISSPFYPARICTPMPRPSEPLPDFIEPELATLVERAPEGDHRQSRRGCVPLRGCKDGGARRQGRRRGRRHLAPDRGGCRGVAADAAAGRSGELTTRRERLGTVPALFQGPAGNSRHRCVRAAFNSRAGNRSNTRATQPRSSVHLRRAIRRRHSTRRRARDTWRGFQPHCWPQHSWSHRLPAQPFTSPSMTPTLPL